MRVHLKGVASATKRLADGRKVKYHYAWRGGPKLDGEPGSADFIASYNAAVATRKQRPTGTLGHLIAVYKASHEFQSLSKRSKEDYLQHIGRIEVRFGDMPTAAISDKRARGGFKAWRDSLAKQSLRQADYAWSVLARILSISKDRGLIDVNPCEKGGRLYEADRSEKIWLPDHIRAFLAVAPEEIRAALVLALWTGQRQGDLLRLTWEAYDGKCIRLRQSKRGERVTIPVVGQLKVDLDAANPVAGTILTNTSGEPWTGRWFRASWAKTFKLAGISDELTFHDLRGTAVTRLAMAECTVPQIAAITGHSLGDVEHILQAHYLGGKVDLAEAASVKLDAAFGLQTDSKPAVLIAAK
jgi:integrase